MQPPHEVPPPEGAGLAVARQLRAIVPSLSTPRLRLRAPTVADFSVYADIALAPEGRFLMAHPSREAAWYDYANMVACWLLRGHGLWAVDRARDDGQQADELVGFVLIGFEPGDHEPELGFMTAAQVRGNGYATEAAQAARAFAFQELGFRTLVSAIDPENTASINVAQKLGATRDPEAESAHDDAVLIFRHRP